MALILENISGAQLDIDDLGFALVTGGTIDLAEESDASTVVASANGGDLESAITGSAIVVKDPLNNSVNLSIADALSVCRSHNDAHYERDRGQVIHVGLHGNDSHSGLTPEKAKLTFGNAITTASALTPSATNRISIKCTDAGTYTETIVIPAHVSIEAQDATINGVVVVSDDSEVTIREIEAPINTPAILKIAGSGSARVNAEVARATGTGDTITTQAGETGVLIVNARQVFTENGSAVVDNADAPSGHIHIDIEDIYITGTGFGIDRDSSNGLILGRVAHILEIGGGIGNGTAIKVDSGRVDLVAGFLNCTTSYNVSGSGTLKLLVNEITGARIQNSGTATVDVLEADILRWITASGTFTPRRIGYVAIDTISGAATMNLPTPPSDGDNISFQDARNNFGTNSLTVDAGVGNLIDDGGAGSQTVVLDVSGTSGIFIYNASIARWTFSRIQEEVAFSPSNLIYVTKNGDDIIGDGSFSNPFLTVARGVTEAQTRVATTPAPTTIKVLDGVYDEVNPMNLTFTNSEYVQVQGEQEFAVTVRPTVPTQPLFQMSSSNANDGPSLNRMTLNADNLPAFKTNNQAAVVMTGPGRFVVDKVEIINCGIGIDSGNGTSTNQEAVYDFATIANCTTGIDAKGDGIQAAQVAYIRNCDVGIRASANVRVEIGNYATQGSDIGSAANGVGFEVNDSAVIIATSGTITNHVTGLELNNTTNSTLLTTSFVGNTTEFNQVDGTAILTIQGALSRTNQLIADGAVVSLNYIDTDTRDFIVGNADATGDPGLQFRVRDADGRVFIGDNAENYNAPTNTVGGSRTVNLIDSNGNFRIWRWDETPGLHPAFEWLKGINTFASDGEGDAPITNIDAGTDTITIDVSGADYNDPLDATPGSDRTTLDTRVFYAGAELRINGTASNDGDYVVSSSTYNAGPETIDVVVTTDITVSEGAGGECVFGGGAGRPDGVSTYVDDPTNAIAAGVGDVHWDMLLRETDSFVVRRRTGGAGKEHFRFFRDRAEFLFDPAYSGQPPLTLVVEGVGGDDYLTINNTTGGPEIDANAGTSTDVDINMIPKGTGTVLVPAGYEANIVDDSLITKQYFDDNTPGAMDMPSVTVGRTTSTAIPTTWGNVLWDTTHVENNTAIVEHDNTNTDRILIQETGLYLIGYSISFDADAGEETIEARLLIDDTTVVPGSVRLASEDDEVNDLSNSFTAELTAGTYLTLQTQASGAGNLFHLSSNWMVTRASGPQGATGPTGPPGSVKTHLSRHNGGITQTFTTTQTTINFGTDIRTDTDYTHAIVVGGSEITINTAGWYKITYAVSLDSPVGTSRTASQTELQVNGTQVAGTLRYGYHRTAAVAENSVTATVILNLALNDVVRVQSVRQAGGDALVTIANACSLTISSVDAP